MVEKVVVGISLALLAPSVIQFVSAWRRRQDRFFRDLGKHVRAQVASRRIWLPLSCVAALLLLPFSLAADKPAAITAISCISGSTILQWLTPPAILLLGVSGSKCNELLPVLLPAVFPAKVFHLLRDSYHDAERGVDLKLHTMFTTSRASEDVGWENVVSIYLRLCERVLVDLRTHSRNLHVELSMIASLAEKRKVLYLVDGDTTSVAFLREYDADEQVCSSVKDAIWRLRTGY